MVQERITKKNNYFFNMGLDKNGASEARIDRVRAIERDAEQLYAFLVSDEKSSTTRAPEPMESATRPPPPKWVHFVAGGVGGMMGAIVTCPLDVVKTRLQSDAYHGAYNRTPKSSNPFVLAAQHLSETGGALRTIYRSEGARALFRGMGPNLVGVIPARSINFFTYGASKEMLLARFNGGAEATWIHLAAGVCAGFVTSTATNPIWLVKTRLQLDKSKGRHYRSLWECLVHVVRREGFFSLYKGLSASYLGGAELTLQWVLYEQMKAFVSRQARGENEKTTRDHVLEWCARSGAAGAAKFVASLITYPHEVVRTRLRQAPLAETGRPKYTGLVQCFRLVAREEGLASMYGGLTPHLLRTVPNLIIMFGTWELVVRMLS